MTPGSLKATLPSNARACRRRQRNLARGVLRVGALALAVSATTSLEGAPALRVQVNQHGGFAVLGNTIAQDCAAGVPAPIVGAVGTCGNNLPDTAPDVFWRSDSPVDGQAVANTGVTVANARSSAVLQLPAGAAVTHAFLYWGATLAGPGSDATALLERPGGASTVVTASQSFTSGSSYQSVADVTAFVQSAGAGVYRLSGVDAVSLPDLNQATAFVGWWLVVLYQRAADPVLTFTLFDGLDSVSTGSPVSFTVSGLTVPAPAGGGSSLAVVGFEGDATITGDSLSVSAVAVSNAANPANNVFNSSRTAFGLAATASGDLPWLTGASASLSGVDVDVFDVTAQVPDGATSLTVSADSTGDTYFLAGVLLATPTTVVPVELQSFSVE